LYSLGEVLVARGEQVEVVGRDDADNVAGAQDRGLHPGAQPRPVRELLYADGGAAGERDAAAEGR